MVRRSKRYLENRKLVDRNEALPLDEAIAVLKKFKPAGFDETVEVAMELGVDTRKADQMVRGAVSLPRGIGREVRVIAFCAEDQVEGAKEAGAVAAGGEELAERIQGGWMDFDVAVAAPNMMRVVGKLGKILGPQGKMPSPKSGTVTPDVVGAVKEFRAGKIEFRADAGGNVHAPVGKLSFEPDALKENIETFVEHIRSLRPTAAKGRYIKKVFVTSTMNPSVPVAIG